MEKFCGEGVFIDGSQNICQGEIPLNEIFLGKDLENKILVLKTGHAKKYGRDEYYENYPVLTFALAEYLIKKKIKAIALDSPSPDKAPYALHKKILQADILIIENAANLDALSPYENFEIFAFPLKLYAEASLIRLVARVK